LSLSVNDIVPCVAFFASMDILLSRKKELKSLLTCYQTRFLGSKCTQNAFSAAGGADSDMAVIAVEDQYALMCIVSNVVISDDLG